MKQSPARLTSRCSWRGLLAASALASVSLGSAHLAHANGRYPEAGQVVVDPSAPDHLWVRGTFGLLYSADGGARFDWVCEEALGYSGAWDPPIASTSGGRLLAGLFDGLRRADPPYCDVEATPDLIDANVSDVAVAATAAERVAVIATSSSSPGALASRLYLSADGGQSFSAAAGFPMALEALTVDWAPSDLAVLYVTGTASDGRGWLLRSDSGGDDWERVVIAGSDPGQEPYLAAVDPSDAHVLYLRLAGERGALLRSVDGGESWTELFRGEGPLQAFALAPDGSRLLVGGALDGIWRSSTADLAFEQVSLVGARCLTWTDRGVYACGDDFQDGFTVGLSTTEGSTFAPVLRLSQVCGPLRCAGGMSVHPTCEERWPSASLLFGSPGCAEPEPADAGEVDPVEDKPPSGCACRVGSSKQSAATDLIPILVALGLAGAFRTRRTGRGCWRRCRR